MMISRKNLSVFVLVPVTRNFLSWNACLRLVANTMQNWGSGEIEDAAERNGSVITDSFERDIAARAGRSRGL